MREFECKKITKRVDLRLISRGTPNASYKVEVHCRQKYCPLLGLAVLGLKQDTFEKLRSEAVALVIEHCRNRQQEKDPLGRI